MDSSSTNIVSTTPPTADRQDRQPAADWCRRTGTLHDHGHTTQIGKDRDVNCNELSARKRSQLERPRREPKRWMLESKANQNLVTGITEVRRIVNRLYLSKSFREQACWLFLTAQSEDLLIGILVFHRVPDVD